MVDIRKLAFESKASQDGFELWKLLELLQSIRPKRILEVGVDKGYLCETWRIAFPDADVTGIDNSDRDLLYKNFNFILADSHDVSTRDNLLADDRVSFDFIFIDGDHTLEGVTKDYELYGPLVAPGGVIAFHDIFNSHIDGVDVRDLFNQLKIKHANVEIHNPFNGPGIGCLFF